MKNEDFENKELELLLKTKMNELSDSVDCFDKISARAFPSEDKDFSESGFTVSDLENVTGRSQAPRILKWTALAAAAVVGIAVIPKTEFARRVLANLGGGSVKHNYQRIISEISSELETGEYRIVDLPLDMYMDYDVLVTPYMSCPFEDCGKDDASVRLFIRQVNGCDTDQIYAVEYAGTYSENNIIAAAEPAFKFTSADLNGAEFAELGNIPDNGEISIITADKLFTDSGDGMILDSDGNKVSLASFTYTSVIKTNDGIKYVTSDILYGQNNDETEIFYDIYSNDTLPDRDKMWKRSVYFNGNSAKPQTEQTKLIRKELFGSGNGSIEECTMTYIMPAYDGRYVPVPSETLTLRAKPSNKVLGTVIPPADTLSAYRIKIYFYIPDDTDNFTVTLDSDKSDLSSIIDSSYFSIDNSDSDIDRLMAERAELERRIAEYNARMAELEEAQLRDEEMRIQEEIAKTREEQKRIEVEIEKNRAAEEQAMLYAEK